MSTCETRPDAVAPVQVTPELDVVESAEARKQGAAALRDGQGGRAVSLILGGSFVKMGSPSLHFFLISLLLSCLDLKLLLRSRLLVC